MTSDKHIAALRQIQEIVSEALRETTAASGRKKQVHRNRRSLGGLQLSCRST